MNKYLNILYVFLFLAIIKAEMINGRRSAYTKTSNKLEYYIYLQLKQRLDNHFYLGVTDNTGETRTKEAKFFVNDVEISGKFISI